MSDIYFDINLTSTPISVVCYDINTIPAYIIILDDSDLTHIKAYNLLSIIITQDIGFDKFYNTLEKNADSKIDIELAMYIWYFQYLKINFQNIQEFNQLMSMQGGMSRNELEELYLNTEVLPILNKSTILTNDIIQKLLPNKNKIQNEIINFQKNYKKTYNDYKQFKSLPTLYFDNYNNINKILIEEEIFITYFCQDNTLDLNILFNSTQLNEFIPFCTYNNYIKVLKDFNLDDHEWLKKNYKKMNLELIKNECCARGLDDKGSKTYMIEKLIDYENENKSENLVNYNKDVITLKYTDGKSKVYDTIIIYKNNKNMITMDIQTKESRKNELIQRLFKVINTSSFVESEKDKKFSGKMFIVNDRDISLNKYIFAEVLMMNDCGFFINEFVNASTNKKTTKLQYDYNTTIQTSIQNNIILGNEKYEVLKDYPKKKRYLQINILLCKNKNQLQGYLDDLSRILYLYFDRFQETLHFYKTYNKKFKEDEFNAIFIKVSSNPISELIGTSKSSSTNWSTSCQPTEKRNMKAYPVNFKDTLHRVENPKLEEYVYEDDNGKQYILWPKDGDERDGVTQHLFSCESEQFPLPGIINDKAKNNFPCCFSKPKEEDDKEGRFNYYINNDSAKENQGYFLTTESILNPNSEGAIINPKILYIVGKGSTRIGVDVSNYSFISCIYTHQNKMTIQPTNDIIKEEIMKIIRSSINSSLESNYDLEIDEIVKNINSNKYFDPRLYTLLLETYYKVNIITFSKEDGEVIIPMNKQGDLFYKYDDTVFVYENTKNNYKRCELIKTTNIIRNSLRFREKFFSNNKIIRPYTKHILFEHITSQFIDPFGKCRIISVRFGSDFIYAYTFLPPLSNVIMKEDPQIENNLNKLLKFIEMYKLKIESQYSFNENAYEINCKDEHNNKYSFKVNCIELSGVTNTRTRNIINYNGNSYKTFVENKKRAMLLNQNLLWAFSQYNKNMEFIIENIDNYLVDVKYYSYPLTTNLDFNNGYYKDKKLIIGSNNPTKLRIRLLQYLKLYSIRFPELLKIYKNKRIVDNYFENISDFKIFPKQYLVYYSETIPKNNNNISIHKHLDDEIYDNPYLYFFNDKLYLAQDCLNLDNSIFISKNWVRNHFNYKYCNKTAEITNYKVYNREGFLIKNNSFNKKNSNIIKVNNHKYISLLPF